MRKWPKVIWTEQCMREGMQIESADIPIDEKVRLLDAISETGLKRIVVGSFVSPKYTPQMARMEEIVQKFHPKPGVIYTALFMGTQGIPRYLKWCPPLTPPDRTPNTTTCHACDVFTKRNTNRYQSEEIARWPGIIKAAKEQGVKEATIGINATFGSNWVGDILQDYCMDLYQKQWNLWNEAGIKVTGISLGDPMGWNMPDQVERYILAIRERWPEIHRWRFHFHNTRGVGLVSHYVVLTMLGPEDTVFLDGSIGGLAGCPYCGNGQSATMVATEDFFYMTQEMGITEGELAGVDLYKICDAAAIAEEVIGHPTWGHVSKAGPRPRGDRLYAMDMPFIETRAQAQHFRKGPSVYKEGCLSPWDEPIKSRQRDYAEWNYGRFKPAKGK